MVTLWVEVAAALGKWESCEGVAWGVAMQPTTLHHEPELTSVINVRQKDG